MTAARPVAGADFVAMGNGVPVRGGFGRGWRLDQEGGTVEHAGYGDGVLSEEYVVATESGYYVAGTRVSLDSIVHAFLGGQTAEAIAQAFPVLTLEQVYGALIRAARRGPLRVERGHRPNRYP